MFLEWTLIRESNSQLNFVKKNNSQAHTPMTRRSNKAFDRRSGICSIGCKPPRTATIKHGTSK
jgi:hypothetical protein